MSTTPAHAVAADPALTFWGAAGGVTGSMHLLEAGNHKILLDCGLHQGRREEARQRNGHFPFHPHQIDAVVISHAHIDHCGNLPAHINIARNYAEPWVQPLYTVSDVEKVFARLVSVPYGRDTDVTKSVRFRFIEAGHVLGSAMVFVTIAAHDRDRTLTFSGDMGRRGLPILRPTGTISPADVLVCESTYGNRT